MTTDKDKKEPKKVVAKVEKAPAKKATPKKAQKKALYDPTGETKRIRRAPTKEVVGAVEKSVPIPEDKPKGKYPLDSLQPGESFLVQCAPKNAKRIRLSIMGATRRVTQKTGAEFLVQVRPEENGVRCWRTMPETPTTLGACASEIHPEQPIPLTVPVPGSPGSFKLPIP